MHKIVVLGIDALEYDLVEEWNLKNLKQQAYCKTDLSDFNVVVTPLIWGAMLTGKKIKEIEDVFVKRAKFFSEQGTAVKKKQRQYLLAKIVSKTLPLPIKDLITRKIVPDSFKKTYNFILKNKYTTMFDFFNKIWNNGVPAYNRNVVTKEVKKLIPIAVKGNTTPLFNYSMNLYKKEKEELLRAIEGDYELIFWYTPSLDEIEHFYITKKSKLLSIYMNLNGLVKAVKEKLEPDDVLYIISDHGMVPIEGSSRGGEHSNHGFFSSSTGELIQKPQDLFYLVKEKATKRAEE